MIAKTYILWTTASHFSLLEFLATTILLPALMSWTSLDTSYKWNHTVFVFCDWHFRNAFHIHLCCNIWQGFLLFCDWMLFHCMNIMHFFTSWSGDGHLGNFYLLDNVTSAAVIVGLQIYFWDHDFNFLDIHSEVRLMDHMIVSIFNFLRKLYSVFHSVYTLLYY